jgi:predicted nucleotidyltransferase
MVVRHSNSQQRLLIDNAKIADFCRRNRIRRFSLYGSVLRDDFRPDSDVDVLIEFESGQEVGLLKISKLQRELSVLLGGRTVDLRTPEDLSRYFREQVLATAEEHYAAGG